MDQQEAAEYMQLLDEAMELLKEKKEKVKQVPGEPKQRRREACIKRVEEIELLLEENRKQLKKFGDLKCLLQQSFKQVGPYQVEGTSGIKMES